MRFLLVILLSGVLLSSCSTIDHRSDTLAKSPLPALSPEKTIKPELLWTNTHSAGVGKTDARLGLSVTSSAIFVADHKGSLFALDPKSGRVQWKQSTKADFSAGPSTVGDRLILGTEDGRVLGYSTSDGSVLWESEVFSPVLAAPRGDGKRVFTHTLGGGVFALDAKSGSMMWQYQVNIPPLVLRHSSSPAFFKEEVIVGFANGKLIAFNQLNGFPVWEKEVAAFKGRSDLQRMIDVSADPIVKNGVVYVVSYQGQIAALNAASGELIWEKELSSYSGIALSNKTLFVCDDRGVLWALNSETGKTLWKQEALLGRFLSAPVTVDQYIVVGDDDGYLHWISQSKGALVGRVSMDSKGIGATPIVKGNVVYALGRGGKVAAYLTTPGK